MKRWLIIAFISSYLSALSYGLVCHTISYSPAWHPMMYYVVWDMFCGWASYAQTTHIVAEGESQNFYELAPAPWGEFRPWGPGGRRDFDPFHNHCGEIALNTLRHTRHEPITRIFVIEESWPKKFDLPEVIWNTRYDVPKDIKRYCRVRVELTPSGQVVRKFDPWLTYQNMRMVADNPRLEQDSKRGRPMFVLQRETPPGNVPLPVGGAPLGN